MKLRVVLSEAAHSLTANVSTTAAATMAVLIGMFLLGLVIALTSVVQTLSARATDQLLVKNYFCTSFTCDEAATPRQIDAARVRALELPEVESVRFISSDEALEIMRRRAPELVENVATNPLPPSLEIKTREPEAVPIVGRRLEAEPLPGTERVNWAEKTTTRFLDFARIVWYSSIVAVLLLGAASAVLIGNTIRLSIFARRREIEVMKLVGASNWFVRGPFMLEGLFCGLAGSIAAVLLLLLGKEIVLHSFLADRDLETGAIPFTWNAAILLFAGLLLGALGSAITLRRFLQV